MELKDRLPTLLQKFQELQESQKKKQKLIDSKTSSWAEIEKSSEGFEFVANITKHLHKKPESKMNLSILTKHETKKIQEQIRKKGNSYSPSPPSIASASSSTGFNRMVSRTLTNSPTKGSSNLHFTKYDKLPNESPVFENGFVIRIFDGSLNETKQEGILAEIKRKNSQRQKRPSSKNSKSKRLYDSPQTKLSFFSRESPSPVHNSLQHIGGGRASIDNKIREESFDNYDSTQGPTNGKMDYSREFEVIKEKPSIVSNSGIRSYSVQKKSDRYMNADPVNSKIGYSKTNTKISHNSHKSTENPPKVSLSALPSKKTERESIHVHSKGHNSPSYKKTQEIITRVPKFQGFFNNLLQTEEHYQHSVHNSRSMGASPAALSRSMVYNEEGDVSEEFTPSPAYAVKFNSGILYSSDSIERLKQNDTSRYEGVKSVVKDFKVNENRTIYLLSKRYKYRKYLE